MRRCRAITLWNAQSRLFILRRMLRCVANEINCCTQIERDKLVNVIFPMMSRQRNLSIQNALLESRVGSYVDRRHSLIDPGLIGWRYLSS